ncbi:MAG: hypothetical protein QXN34_06875 [Archaeoglobaceae archaeon]
MSFKEVYESIFQAIKNILLNISSIKAVNIGEMLKLTDLPLAVVIPRDMRFEKAGFSRMLQCTLNIDIIIMIRETEPENWFADIIVPMSDVLEALLVNDALNSIVKSLMPTFFSPGEITARNKLYYGGLIRIIIVFTFTY